MRTLPPLLLVLASLSMGPTSCEGLLEDYDFSRVVIASPEEGSVYTSAQTVTLLVDIDPELAPSVTKVEFFDHHAVDQPEGHGTPTCIDERGPVFSCEWRITAANNGPHYWNALAYFDGHPGAFSAPVELVVDIRPGARSLPPPPRGCSDGVDCYCDGARDPSDPRYDPDLLFCEDFEAFENSNASLWNTLYGSSVNDCGAGSTRAGTAPDACINFLREGACDAHGGDPGDDCVLDGNTALGFKYEQGRTGGIFGEARFAPTRTLGITYATKHTENFAPAGPAWKSNEYGKGWHCLLGCSTGANTSAGYFAANGTSPAMGREFYPYASLWFSFIGGPGNAARFSNAVVSRGAAFANDVQFGFTPLQSDFDPATDNPRGHWVCRRVHIDGWGETDARYREWVGGKLLIDVANFDASNILHDGSDPIDLFVWNHYFNGTDGTGSGYPGPTRAYRIEDNVHLTAAPEPISCAAIGLP